MIESIKLTRFKQFKDTEIQLRPFTILMGENNSGKTSVLQAIWLGLAGLHQGKLLSVDWKTGQARVSSTGYHMYDVPFAPQGDFSGLFHNRVSREGQTYDENSGAMIQLTDDRQNCLRLHLRELFKNLNFKLLTLPQDLRRPELQNYAPLYISGFSGLHFHEERMFPAVMEARIAGGSVNSIVRNIVLDLKLHAPQKYQYLESLLDEEFGFRMKDVHFRENDELYVFSEYEERRREGEASLEFSSSGSGMMQILQVLAVILRYCPEKTRVVLIDEPEAHLHGNLQVRFLNILMKMQQELGIQMILSTHSEAMIQNADPENVIPVLAHAPVNKNLVYSAKAQRILEDRLGAYELGKAKISGKIAFFEDSSLKIFERMADVLHMDSFCGMNTIPMIRGWKREDELPFALGLVLREMLEREIEIHLVCGSAGRSQEEIDQLRDKAEQGQVQLHLLSCREADDYILNAELIYRTIRSDGKNAGLMIPSAADIQDKITRKTVLLSGEETLQLTADERVVWNETEIKKKEENPEKADAGEIFTWLAEEKGIWITRKSLIRNLQQEDIPEEIKVLLDVLRADLSPYQLPEETDYSAPVRKDAYEQLTFFDM